MALLIETLRNQIMSSIWGRRLGLDKDGFVIGQKGPRDQIEDISTTAASSASPFGTTRVLTSGSSQNSQYTLQVMPVGAYKILMQPTSTSTGVQTFTAASGVAFANSSDGSTSAVISLLGKGAVAMLQAVSSTLIVCLNVTGSSASPLVSFTTST